MQFEVTHYEHPNIFVRNCKTREIHQFHVHDDVTLADDLSRFDLGDAKRAAIAYLFNYRRTMKQLETA
jgi:hypothetical protein